MKEPLFLRPSIFVFFVLLMTSCQHYKFQASPTIHTYPAGDTVRNWVEWNVLFRTPDADKREKELGDIKDGLARFVNSYAKLTDRQNNPIKGGIGYNIYTSYCNNDSLLSNIVVDLALKKGSDTTGGSVIASPTPIAPVVTGDAVVSISPNTHFNILPYENLRLILKRVPIDASLSVSHSQILGIIDTGIDTTLFAPGFQKILSSDPAPFNSIPGADFHDVSDHQSIRHGSAVTAIALEQYDSAYPTVLVIKAFDNDGAGSSFSTSCAVKYAIEHHVTVINASWGSYGSSDPVLAHYIQLARQQPVPIPVIAAAGNDNNLPSQGFVCDPSLNTANALSVTTGRLFYPACIAADTLSNVISVTGLSNKNMVPCFYQNYSGQFVSVGVRHQIACCEFYFPYLSAPIEGTSFETAVVTGVLGNYLLHNQQNSNPQIILNLISQQSPATDYTRLGRFIMAKKD